MPYCRRRGQPVISGCPEILDADLRFVMVRLHGSYPGAVRFPVHGGSGDGAMLREPNHSHNHSQRACGWARAMDVRVGACVEWRGGVDGSVMAVMCVCGGWSVRIHPFRFSVRWCFYPVPVRIVAGFGLFVSLCAPFGAKCDKILYFSRTGVLSVSPDCPDVAVPRFFFVSRRSWAVFLCWFWRSR